MPSKPADRRRKEYRAILQSGQEIAFAPTTEANRCILAEVRAEVENARREIQEEADQCSKTNETCWIQWLTWALNSRCVMGAGAARVAKIRELAISNGVVSSL